LSDATEPRSWKRWVFLAVPIVGVLELCAHVAQTRGAVSENDWIAARDAVKSQAQPSDLVVFAPRWTDPVGRRYFGPELATFEREARPDESRFPRAVEVSIRGMHAPELAGWKKLDEKRVGAITITTLANPQPAALKDDLLAHVAPDKMQVVRTDGGGRELECGWVQGPPQTGNLGFGPGVPGNRFNCPISGFVGISVVADLDYKPRRCIYAPPPGGNAALRITFKNVAIGAMLHGHHALYVEAERQKTGAPVTLRFRIGDRSLGSVVHNDGDGWKAFDLPTTEWAGQTQDIVAEVSSPRGERRMYCFEADTR
jgi:hypothetical protein